jgi:hypothetical protein
MRRLSYFVANVLGGVVLALLVIDPTLTLWPVFVLLGLAVLFFVLPRFLPPKRKKTGRNESPSSSDFA